MTWVNLNDVYVPKAGGGTIDGDLIVNGSINVNGESINLSSSTKPTMTAPDVLDFIHSESGNTIGVGVGAGGVNRGIYDRTLGKWLFHTDGSKAYLFQNELGERDAWYAASGDNGQTCLYCGKWMIALLAKSITPSTSNSNGVYTGSYTWTFNHAFAGVPYVFTTVNVTSAQVTARASASAQSTTSVKITFARSTNAATTIYALAIGPRE